MPAIGASRAITAIHDGRIHLLLARRRIDGTPPRIEERFVLERHDGCCDAIDRRSAIRQHGTTRVEGAAEAGVVGRLPFRRHPRAQDRAGASMDRKGEIERL